MTVLADTSIWVQHLRHGAAGSAVGLDPLLSERRVIMFGVVAAELLSGLPGRRTSELWRLLEGMTWIDLDRDGWRKAGDASAELRRRGTTTPLTDIAIAVAAIDAGVAVWADDAHFDRIGEVLPDLRRFVPR